MMNDRLFLTEDPNTQLAIELARLRERVAALEAIEQPIRDTGLWTPAFARATATYTTATTRGSWVRVGALCFIVGRIDITAISVTPTGSLQIETLPFPAVADADSTISGMVTMTSWTANIPAGYTQVEGQITSTAPNVITLVRTGDNVAPAACHASELALVSDAANFHFASFRFAGVYRVA